jgi:hypothetical protein
MTPARLRLLILIAAPVLAVAWFLWWSRTAVQVERTFHGLKTAIEQGSAGGVFDRLHSAYDVRRNWPDQFAGEAGDLPLSPATLRLLVQRGLTALFQLQQPDPFVFTYRVARITARDDGEVEVLVSITLATQAGLQPLTFTPPLVNQRFVLAQDGWWPALYIRSHAPFHVSY